MRRTTSISGPTTAASLLASRLIRACGKAPSTSSISGIGSLPPTRAACTSDQGRSADRPGPVAGAAQVVVVEGHQHAVGRDPGVGLEVPVARARVAASKAGHRVLQALQRSAAVGERNGPGMVQERVRHAGSIVGPWLTSVRCRWPGSATPPPRPSPSSRRTTGPCSGEVPACTAGRRRPGRRRRPRPRWPPGRCRRGSGPRSSTPRRACWPSGGTSSPASSPRRRPSRSRPPGSRPSGPSGTFQFAAAEARKLAGEMVPLDARRAGRGQARLHAAGADRRGRRHPPVQLPAQPRGPQGGAGHRRRLPGGAEAGQPDAVLVHRPGRAAHRRVRPSRRAAPRRDGWRGHRGQRHRRPPRRRAHHLHRLARGRLGHPGARAAQAGRPRARATTPRSSSSPTATGRAAAAKIRVAGF